MPTPKSGYLRDVAHIMIANLLNTRLRTTDVSGHFDNDYLILLPATLLIGGLIVASRLADHAKFLSGAPLKQLRKGLEGRLDNATFDQKKALLDSLRIDCLYDDDTGEMLVTGTLGKHSLMIIQPSETSVGCQLVHGGAWLINPVNNFDVWDLAKVS